MIPLVSRITLHPEGLVIHADRGTPVRELLLKEGILLDFPCGGRGRCNQCRIKIEPPPESGTRGENPLPDLEVAQGIRLACRAVVEGDCTITLPEDRAPEVPWKAPAGPPEGEFPPGQPSAEALAGGFLPGQPLVHRKSFSLPPPSLKDQRADWDRLRSVLGIRGEAPVRDLEPFGRFLRANQWRGDAILEQGCLLAIRPEGEAVYGFAVDLGTTTVDLSLHDLDTGRRIGRRTLGNRQAAFGADVVSRAEEFQTRPGEVREAALETIQQGAAELLAEAGLSPQQVVRSVVVGNPIMIHILHDLNPRQLTQAPYIPRATGLIRRPVRDFPWDFQQYGWVETLPLISAFVGADTLGVILALDLEHDPETSLTVDVGTNGEIVLSRGGRLFTTSTAAGPAFEGAQISCGMRAAGGAITAVSLPEAGSVILEVIGGGKPAGICGSGLISCVAGLLDAGLVDGSGRLVAPEEVEPAAWRPRLIRVEDQPAFLLSEDPCIYLSQRDIRELQLAKGAVRTGIDMLLAEIGVSASQLKQLRLAGNFGSGVEVSKAMRLGLIPKVDMEAVDVVGNAALRGAALVLLSRDYRQRALHLPRRCRFLELAGKADFQLRFTESMLF